MLLVNRSMVSDVPQTREKLRDFFIDKLNGADLKDVIESIYCAEIARLPLHESLPLLDESKLDDFIEKHKWSRDDALKPNNFKILKKAIKQRDAKTKAAVEKHFANMKSKPTNSRKVPKLTASVDSVEQKSQMDYVGQLMKKDTSTKVPSHAKDGAFTLTLFDNKLLDVKAEDGNIGFVFSKSKKELELDKKTTQMFSL